MELVLARDLFLMCKPNWPVKSHHHVAQNSKNYDENLVHSWSRFYSIIKIIKNRKNENFGTGEVFGPVGTGKGTKFPFLPKKGHKIS